NDKGAERAIATEAVSTLGFPYSLSPTFPKQNQNQTLEEALEVLEKIKQKTEEAGLRLVVYIPMAFGNPYGDLWNAEEVIEGARNIVEMGVETISLADTVGLSDATKIAGLVKPVIAEFGRTAEIGVHLHSRREQAAEKILAAYDAGCRRFDSALGGLGGCPFAQDELVGNIPTEILLETLTQRAVQPPIKKSLAGLVKSSREIAGVALHLVFRASRGISTVRRRVYVGLPGLGLGK